jgi:hypothetical protein
MFQEYALEPELVATWGKRENYRVFAREFGIGNARLVAQYPKRWAKRVWDSAHGCEGKDRTRLEILLRQIDGISVRRQGSVFDDSNGSSWMQNAAIENARLAFHAILATANPAGNAQVLVGDNVDEQTPLWSCPRGIIVPRQATQMAAAIGVLLRYAQEIVLVDPYMSPSAARRKIDALRAFLTAIAAGRGDRPPRRIEVQMLESVGGAAEDFPTNCQSRARDIPHELVVRFVRWRERDGGLRFHNRYILTELGGVQFAHGLDEGQPGEEDDITLLDKGQFDRRWDQYGGSAPAFDLSDPPVEVTGTRRL